MPVISLNSTEIPDGLLEFLEREIDKRDKNDMPPLKYNGVIGDSCDCAACNMRRTEEGPDLNKDMESEVPPEDAQRIINSHKDDPETPPLAMIKWQIARRIANYVQCAEDTMSVIEKVEKVLDEGKKVGGKLNNMQMLFAIKDIAVIMSGMKYLGMDVPDLGEMLSESIAEQLKQG